MSKWPRRLTGLNLEGCKTTTLSAAKTLVACWRIRRWQVLPEGDASKFTNAMRALGRHVDRLREAEAEEQAT